MNLSNIFEDPEDYSPKAPHNVGLPTLTWRRPDKKSKTGLESLESNFKRWYVPGGMYDTRYKEYRTNIPVDSRARPKEIESLPEDRIRRNVEALRAAKELGYNMPAELYDPKFLTALLIKEGRSDFGGSEANLLNFEHNKKAVELYNDLSPRFGEKPAAIAALMYDKGQVAKRIKKPFPMVWNGVGVSRDEEGRLIASGENYAKKFPEFIEAAARPENKNVFNFINNYLTGAEYTTPLPKSTRDALSQEYESRQRQAYGEAQKKLKESTLRDLQYTFFGSEGLFGVPKEYDPIKMERAVPSPDFDALRKRLKPEYNSGGTIENTTHDRKII